nr:hypothetical protein RP007_05089 [Rhizobium sp. P007]
MDEVLQFDVVAGDETILPVGENIVLQLGAEPCLYRHRLRQARNAVLADHLALYVVTVVAVHEDFDVDDRAPGRFQNDDLRVPQLCMAAGGGTWKENPGRHIVVIEQPAQHVDLMDHRVVDCHGRHILLRNGRVAMGGMDHDRGADHGVHGLFQRHVTGVVAAHETHLHQPFAMRHLSIDDPLRALCRRRQRLFAEARLAGGDGRQHILLMRRAPGSDKHGIHIS